MSQPSSPSPARRADLRTANLLGALAGAVVEQVAAATPRTHPNQTDTSVAALKLVAEFAGLSNVALSQALGLSHPATVRLVDRLETAGLVERRAGGDDRRAIALHPTPAGRERVRGLLTDRVRTTAELLDVLSAEQRRALDDIAETLLHALTATPLDAAHLCRLCDEAACPGERCPVHRRAADLIGAPGAPER